MPRARFFVASALPLLVLSACGSRTGLLELEGDQTTIVEPPGDDAGVTPIPDASLDATVDGAIPPIEAGPPPVIVVKSDCEDASTNVIYVVTETNEVVSFDPGSGSFVDVGPIDCPAPPDYQPFSMAVDRTGHAYILFNNPEDQGLMFRASLATLECTATSYVAQSDEFDTFGMGFATDLGGPSEQLYILGDGTPSALGTVDTSTFRITKNGEVDEQVFKGELTGTGDGRLFTFYTPLDSSDGFANVGQLDKTTGKLLATTHLPGVNLGEGWAFGFFGGSFYLFTGDGFGNSNVTLYNPADGTTRVLASYPALIVGAGVSTCAPEK